MAIPPVNLPPAFRFALFSANELLNLVATERAAAHRAWKNGLPHDWTGATNRLREQEDRAKHYFMPIQPALAVVGTRALRPFRETFRLCRETTDALTVFHTVTARGTKPLRISAKQRQAFQQYLDALTMVPRQQAEDMTDSMKVGLIRAVALVERKKAQPPEGVVRGLYEQSLAKEYLREIGALEADTSPPVTGFDPGYRLPSRPAACRDHLFLSWYEAKGEPTYKSHATIRDNWNGLNLGEREEYSPQSPKKIRDGEKGRQVVITAIKNARAERDKAKRPVRATT
jgi:hypothetical protein